MTIHKLKRGSVESMIIGLFCTFTVAGLFMAGWLLKPHDIDRFTSAIAKFF